jgi:hypothetical protein
MRARTASIPIRPCSRSRSSSFAMRREVQHADDALEQQVLDAHLSQLLLEPLAHLLLGRPLTRLRTTWPRLTLLRVHAVDTPSGTYVRFVSATDSR